MPLAAALWQILSCPSLARARCVQSPCATCPMAMRCSTSIRATLKLRSRGFVLLTPPTGFLTTATTAEMVKLAENTYRDVNIGLANQFATFAEANGIDVYAVIDACNSQPFSHIHRPGIAVGGHCIPIYPRMYLWNDPSATVVRAAREAVRVGAPDARRASWRVVVGRHRSVGVRLHALAAVLAPRAAARRIKPA